MLAREHVEARTEVVEREHCNITIHGGRMRQVSCAGSKLNCLLNLLLLLSCLVVPSLSSLSLLLSDRVLSALLLMVTDQKRCAPSMRAGYPCLP